MKRLFIAFACFAVVQLYGQQTQIAVQSGHNDIITQVKLDPGRGLMITYGSFSDKTLKFWDKSNGMLYKTIDIPEHARTMAVDTQLGRTYLGTENEIIVYDNSSLSEIKRIAVKQLNTMVLNPLDGKLYANFGTEGNVTFKIVDPASGSMTNATDVPWPSQGKAMYSKIAANGQFIQFDTEFVETFLYSFEAKQYGALQSPPLLWFENADMLFADYMDLTHVRLIRYNGYENKNVWEKVLVIEKLDRMTKPHAGQFALTPDHKGLWVAPAQSTLMELDAATGDVKGVIYTKNKKNNIVADNTFVYALEKDNDNLFAKGSYNKYRRYDENPVAHFGYKNFVTNDFEVIPGTNSFTLLTSDLYGGLASFEADAGNSRMTSYNAQYTESYSLSGKLYGQPGSKDFYFAMSNVKEGLKGLQLGNADSFKTLMPYPKSGSGYRSVDPNSGRMIIAVRNSIDVIDFTSRRSIYQAIVEGTSIVNYDFLFMPDKRGLLLYMNDEVVPEADYRRRLEYHDIISKKVLWKRDHSYSSLHLINGGSQILGLNIDTDKVDILDSSNGSLVRTFGIGPVDFGTDAFLNPSNDRLMVVEMDKGTTVYDLQGNRIGHNDNFNELYSVNLDFVNDRFYAESSDGSTKFYELESGKEVLRLYLFDDGEWIAHTPEGLFDGSQNAWDRLSFANGRQSIPLDRVFDTFYTPRLVYKVLYEGNVEKPDIDIDKLKRAPSVALSYSEGSRNLTVEDDIAAIETANANAKITVSANAHGDRISEIRLFHNGKRVTRNTRNLVVEDDVPTGNEISFDITLLEGENTFSAVALNSQNTESAPESLVVTYNKPKSVVQEVSGIQVHAVVIGINDYKNPKYNLNYAVADANGFTSTVKSGMEPITTKVHTYIIQNGEASRTKILETLQQVSEKAKPQDIFLFYYAGHGVVTQGDSKEFFLVPYDVTQLYGAEESLKQKGISANELKQIASGIPAQKQLYILDACQSAGALTAVASSRGVAEEKAIAQLARSTGTHWLTASGSEQYATEFDELGHGVFTYVLLEALSGKADSGDKRITVNELKAYLESRVPELSEKYKGSPQYPSSFGFGQDFPVSVKN